MLFLAFLSIAKVLRKCYGDAGKKIQRTLKTSSAIEAKFIDDDIQRELTQLWKIVESMQDNLAQEELFKLTKAKIEVIVENNVEK